MQTFSEINGKEILMNHSGWGMQLFSSSKCFNTTDFISARDVAALPLLLMVLITEL